MSVKSWLLDFTSVWSHDKWTQQIVLSHTQTQTQWQTHTLTITDKLIQTLRDRDWDTHRDTHQQPHPLTDTQTRNRVKGLKFSSHNLRSVSLGTGQNSWGAHFFIRTPKFRPRLGVLKNSPIWASALFFIRTSKFRPRLGVLDISPIWVSCS